jgi:uncharacterized membrane protein YhaH (DUF805 family)
MTFFGAVSNVFKNYVGFSGRAARSEYWYWVLFVFIVNLALLMLDRAMFEDMVQGPFSGIFSLLTLLPSIAVAVRRLHDVDRTGWWFLLVFIPVIGWIVLLVWFCTKGTAGANRFGADPLGGA